MQPWNAKLRSSFAASLDLEISAEKMALPCESADLNRIEQLERTKEKYLKDLLESQADDERSVVWNSSGIARLSKNLESKSARYCSELLKEVEEDNQLPLLATLATMSGSAKIDLDQSEIELSVETVLDLLEANENPVPSWLPILLSAKAAEDKRTDLTFRCSQLGINGKSSRSQSYTILFESIRMIESNRDSELVKEWTELALGMTQNILAEKPTDQIARLMQVSKCFPF